MDELPETLDTVGVIPIGTPVVVVPAEVVYQVIVPADPLGTLVVETAKVADPAYPETIVPTCAPRLAVGWITVRVTTEEVAEP